MTGRIPFEGVRPVARRAHGPLVGPEPRGEAKNTVAVARRLLPRPVSWCARGCV